MSARVQKEDHPLQVPDAWSQSAWSQQPLLCLHKASPGHKMSLTAEKIQADSLQPAAQAQLLPGGGEAGAAGVQAEAGDNQELGHGVLWLPAHGSGLHCAPPARRPPAPPDLPAAARA